MKRILILTVSLLVASILCDKASAQFNVGFGYVLSHDIRKTNGAKEDASAQHGFTFGGTYDFLLEDFSWGYFAFVPGINYEFLSDEGAMVDLDARETASTKEHFINVPIHIKYGYEFEGDVRLYCFAGPTLAFGLASQSKIMVERVVNGKPVSGHLTYHNYSGKLTSNVLSKDALDATAAMLPDTKYGWFDVKMGLGVGCELIEDVDFRVGYDFGLINRDWSKVKGNSIYTNLFYVRLSYVF